MKRSLYIGLLAMLVMPLGMSVALAQSGTVQGTITDGTTGDPLPGANVILATPGGATSTMGGATNFDGNYTIANVPAGTYDLVARFVGYSDTRISVTVADGQTVTQNVTLEEEGIGLNTVVVTASRQAEKVLDAPASISVLSTRDVEEQGTTSAAGALRNVTGVDAAQTGADRFEVVLRGFNNAFSGATFALVDYRQGAIASLGVNAYNSMPISNVDTERIEVVRGPGSALYGAGVDAGVIHFITKNPFSSPGTTVSVYGGERSLVGVNFRHAGVLSEKLGYKVAGTFAQVDDWELDPDDAEDAIQLAGDARERVYDAEKINGNAMIEYRFSPTTSLILNGGHSTATNTFLSGIGTVQADGFGYSYGQVRLQSGGLFAQAYLNKNEGGDSFVYGTGDPVVDSSQLFNAQAQYDFELAEGRNRVIVGVDFEQTTPKTGGTIYGRNEENDQITEYGAYLQSATHISPKLDLTVAGRVDYNNIVDAVQFSPRVALVFKPADAHSMRATYNRAFSSPGNNSLFLDIIAQETVLDPVNNRVLRVRARGAADGFTYARNSSNELMASFAFPLSGWNTLTTPSSVSIDHAELYDFIYATLSQLSLDDVNAALGLTLSEAVFNILLLQLRPDFTQVGGSSTGGVLARPRLAGGVDFIEDVVDIPPLSQTTSQTFEAGYKGLFNNKVLLAVDAYYTNKKNFVGPLLFESPIVLMPQLQAEFANSFAQGITNNSNLSAVLATIQGQLPDRDFSPEGVANAVLDLAAALFGAPVAVVQPVENQSAEGPEILLSYRNFGDIDYWGMDVSTQILVNENMDLFGSLSLVSDDFFDAEEVGEPGSDKSVALNATRFKFKAGANVRQDQGFNVNVSARYTDGFPVASGPYVGDVPSFFLLDVGFGYDLSGFTPGLRLDANIQNVLNNEHREFVGAPLIGRFASGRLTYSF